MFTHENIVGLIPAAGSAARLPDLRFSKELIKVVDRSGSNEKPDAIIDRLMDDMRSAGASKAIIVTRRAKRDLQEYLSEEPRSRLPSSFVFVKNTPSVPYTLSFASSFLKSSTVLFGFPDILYQPRTSFPKLLTHQADAGSDLVLGLFRTTRADKSDMVEYDAEYRLRRITIKTKSPLPYAWALAVWRPRFTEYLGNYVANWYEKPRSNSELQLSTIITEAQIDGLKVTVEVIHDGEFLDVGTPDDLARMQDFFAT